MITAPNVISLLRLLLIPFLLLLVLHINDRLFPWMIFLYFFTVSLDFLDGFIARRYAQESEWGKILDPVADKILVLSLLLALTFKANFPVWLAVIIILRDLLILLASIVLYKGKRIISSSLVVGKVTFALLSLLIFIFLLDLHESIDLTILKKWLIILSFTFLVWSGIEYGKVFLREKHDRKKTNFNCG